VAYDSSSFGVDLSFQVFATVFTWLAVGAALVEFWSLLTALKWWWHQWMQPATLREVARYILPLAAGALLLRLAFSGAAFDVRFAASRDAFHQIAMESETERLSGEQAYSQSLRRRAGLYVVKYQFFDGNRLLLMTTGDMMRGFGLAHCPDGSPPRQSGRIYYGSHIDGDWWRWETH